MNASQTLATKHQSLVYVILLIILAGGFLLRTWNINFDRGIGSHPDERSTACFYATTIALPNSWNDFWNPQQSPLNPLWDVSRGEPRSFTYGHLPLYLGVAMGNLLHWSAPLANALALPEQSVELMQRANQSCDALAVAGRITIAILDTITILLVYALGMSTYNRATGLVAAALYAATAQAVQLSHFFAMDPASTTFTVLAVLAALRYVLWVRKRDLLLLGAAMGLAISSKFSALPILMVPVISCVLIWIRTSNSRHQQQAAGIKRLWALISVPGSILVAGLLFFVTSPYAVLDWQQFVQATLIEQGRMVRGIADFPFTRQYRNTVPYIYFLRQQIQWGMWWPLGLLAMVGALFSLGQVLVTFVRLALRKTHLEHSVAPAGPISTVQVGNVLMWSWVLPYFLITGAFLAKFNRYMSPLLPFLALFGAGFVYWIWRQGQRTAVPSAMGLNELEWSGRVTKPSSVWSWAASLIAGVAIVGSVFWSLAYVNGVYGHEHTWITASRWIYEHAPRNSVILWELWDDPLPKAIPGEPGMDMGAHGLRNIDWGPYEEETLQKYETLRAKLQEADYVVYSSKRIYDSVDELPERYPMTLLYYEAMWDGRLGFELVADIASPPRLLGIAFDDRTADESWSLYDHPQVAIFEKRRQLSNAEFDSLFGKSWEDAEAYYRGEESFLSPVLIWLGLGRTQASENVGLINIAIGLLRSQEVPESTVVGPRKSLDLDMALHNLPLVDNYRWNNWASSDPVAAVVTWWLALLVIGWFAWPICFALFGGMRDHGYLISKMVGWLVSGWLLWSMASYGVLLNSVRNSWLMVIAVGAIGAVLAFRQRRLLWAFLARNWHFLLITEIIVAFAYVFMVGLRLGNPDLWQPWFGGEKFMEFAFLNGILRSPTFPPVDPHYAGGYINYYYFGLFLASYLIKLTGIYAEVAFNLLIPTLFALAFATAFAIGYNAVGTTRSAPLRGVLRGLLAPVMVLILGNLDAFAQILRSLARNVEVEMQSVFVLPSLLVNAALGLYRVVFTPLPMPGYDFWAPSRVVAHTINEFPYWSFLFADLHPHLIGIPISLLFLYVVFAIVTGRNHYGSDNGMASAVHERIGDQGPERRLLGQLAMPTAAAFLLGTLASVNLWELPTYLAIGLLATIVRQFWLHGKIAWHSVGLFGLVFLSGAYLFYYPFFANYVNIGASGIGLVKAPDEFSVFLLVWGLFVFLLATWLIVEFRRTSLVGVRKSAVERLLCLYLVRFEKAFRVYRLHRQLVRTPSVSYLGAILALAVALLGTIASLILGYGIVALCLLASSWSFILVWRRKSQPKSGGNSSTTVEPIAQYIAILSLAGFSILGGTQIVFLRDFLQEGDWYRMNTIFKFYNQAWVLLGIAAAIALPGNWRSIVSGLSTARRHRPIVSQKLYDNLQQGERSGVQSQTHTLTQTWTVTCVLLLGMSLAYPIFGTPARLSQRLVGWKPQFGTLNSLDYMRNGSYTWPNADNTIELRYDHSAILWLLDNVRGNTVLIESSEVDYYRAGGTRVASVTGLSGLRGMHESEQRYAEQLSSREAIHREFWSTPDVERMAQIIDEVDAGLVFVGSLERQLHSEAIPRLALLAERGLLVEIYRNPGAVVYAVASKIMRTDHEEFVPIPSELLDVEEDL